MNAERLLIDERDGRVIARQLGLSVTGVLGVLLRAKHDGHIATVKPEIQALRVRANFFVDAALEAKVLSSAGE